MSSAHAGLHRRPPCAADGRRRRAPAQSRATARRDRRTRASNWPARSSRAARLSIRVQTRALGALGQSGDAVARARRCAVRCVCAVGLERGAEPLRAGVEPHAAALDLAAQKLRRQPPGDARELRVVDLRVGAQRPRQPLGAGVEPLARDRQQLLGVRQRARRGAQLGAAVILGALPAGQRPARLAHQLGDQVGAHRHRHLGGGGRRRRALVGGEVDQGHVGLVADRRDQRDHALGRGAHHDLLVERPQVLQRAAAARDDEQVGPADAAAFRQRVEAADRGGDLLGRAVALHLDRPDDDVAREAVGEAMQDVADHRAGRRGDDADHLGQERQELLARLVEQAFGGELPLALLEQRHQRAEAGGLQRLDDDLVARAVRIGGELAGDDDLHALFGLHPHAGEGHLPDHAVDLGALVLEREIDSGRSECGPL